MNKANNVTFNPDAVKKYKGSDFKYSKNFRLFLIIEAFILIIGVVLFLVRGFNLDIDFVGGTVMQYRMDKVLENSDLDRISKITEEAIGFAPSSVVKAEGGNQVIIKTLDLTSEERDKVFDAVSAEYNIDPDSIMVDSKAPIVGKALRNNTIMSVIIAVVLMLIYVTIRFDFFSGLATVVCLISDICVTLIFYSILQIPMNTSVIAALLTIFAYSINATIIIFDRVRENLRLMRKEPFNEVVDRSINQTLARSVNTTLTTFFTIFMIYLLGVDSIKNFVLPLIIGILSGLFSSVCLAGSLWVLFTRNKRPRTK